MFAGGPLHARLHRVCSPSGVPGPPRRPGRPMPQRPSPLRCAHTGPGPGPVAGCLARPRPAPHPGIAANGRPRRERRVEHPWPAAAPGGPAQPGNTAGSGRDAATDQAVLGSAPAAWRQLEHQASGSSTSAPVLHGPAWETVQAQASRSQPCGWRASRPTRTSSSAQGRGRTPATTAGRVTRSCRCRRWSGRCRRSGPPARAPHGWLCSG